MYDVDTSVNQSPLILIVDDDHSVRSLLSLAMEEEGYRVVEAKDGEQCLLEYKRVEPNMILLDAVMPGMDGFTCCQRLRNLTAGDRHSLSILMITVLDDQDSVEQAFAAGATDYITKPINWSVLSQRVGRLLAASQSFKAAQQVKQQLRQQQAWEQLWRKSTQQLLQDNVPTVINSLMAELQHFWQVEQVVVYQEQSQGIAPSMAPGYILVKDLSLENLNLETELNNSHQQGQASIIENPQHLGAIINALGQVNSAEIKSMLLTPVVKRNQLRAILCASTSTPRLWNKIARERFYDLGNLLALAL